MAATAAAASSGAVAVTVHAANGTETVSIPEATVRARADVRQFMTFMPATSAPKASGNQSGLSIGGVAQLAGLVPPQVTQATVTTAAAAAFGAAPSNTSLLSGTEVADGFFGDPTGAPKLAIVQSRGADGFDFIRPMRAPGDDNGDNEVYTAIGEDLNVAFDYAGDVLAVGPPAASDATPTVGAPVTFSTPSVTLNGATDRNGLTYAWDFGDASPAATLASPSHSYTVAGSWVARVTVTDAGGASGVSPPVTIQAGTPAPAPAGQPPPPVSAGSGGLGPPDATPGGADAGTTTPGVAVAPQIVVTACNTAAGGAPCVRHTTPAAHPGHTRTHKTTTHSTTTQPTASDPTQSSSSATATGTGTAPTAGDTAGSVPPYVAAPGPAPSGSRASTSKAAALRQPGLIGVVLSDPGARAIALASAAPALPAARATRDDHTASWGWWLLGGAALFAALAAGALRALELRAGYRSLAAS